MRRISRACVTVLLAGALAFGTASGARAATITVTESCAYAGGQFAVAGTGFDPNQRVSVEVMSTADPSAGTPVQSAVATADRLGTLLAIFDVPAEFASPAAPRSVRARAPGDPRPGPASLLAAAPLRIAARTVAVSGGDGTAGAVQRWQLTGLPDGTRLYAHYRHGGKTVARRFLGVAADPCGRLRFDLRTLPRGFGRDGTWELWMTAQPTFRRPAKGVYVHRRLTARGSRPGSRVGAGATASRLAPLDPRLTSPVTNGMAADASQIGLLTLTAVDMAAPVLFERIDDRLKLLGTSTPVPGEERLMRLRDATTWSCERRDRYFVATSTRPDGGLALATFSVRTPSCARRFELGVPRRVAVGRVVRVRVADRWALGAITPTLCITAPGSRRACRRAPLAAGVAVTGRSFRATARGRWRVELRLGDRRVASAVVVAGEGAVAKAPPTLLATGDSTMQGLDASLGDELGDAVTLASDVHIGSGISRAAGADEVPGAPAAFGPELARAQTARLRQATTVVSLGAAEGFDMTTPDNARVACCDARWQDEYARRVRELMQIYLRNGRGRVLWLTIPLPRAERRVAIVRAVNQAIVAAGLGVPGVQVLRMDTVFTPDGYRDVMRYRGRDVAVRDVDGVHLNVAGTAIEASIVAEALRAG